MCCAFGRGVGNACLELMIHFIAGQEKPPVLTARENVILEMSYIKGFALHTFLGKLYI